MIDTEYLIQQFNNIGIKLDSDQIDKFAKYYNLLVETNKQFNLTTITEWHDVVTKHFVDSCMGSMYIPNNAKVIDVGSGAGFPSIPLKIIRKDLTITMLDSLSKRVNFLNKAIKELGLTNIVAVHGRAEDYVKVSRETYDVAVARAVASMNTLSEYLLPYVRIGGVMIAYKANVEEELNNCTNALNVLGGKLNKVYEHTIGDMLRSIVIVDKICSTSIKYPRGQNKPRINPL